MNKKQFAIFIFVTALLTAGLISWQEVQNARHGQYEAYRGEISPGSNL